MSIAHDWAKERRGPGGSPLEGVAGSRPRREPQPWQLDGVPPSERPRAEPTGAASDKILRMVAGSEAGGDEVSFNEAMARIVEGLQDRRVTFRRNVTVKRWDDARSNRLRLTFDKFADEQVAAGTRGTTRTVMVDGRDLVLLDDGRKVLAHIGRECRYLRWWHRLVDRVRGRRFEK